jgi:hypothetical protein
MRAGDEPDDRSVQACDGIVGDRTRAARKGRQSAADIEWSDAMMRPSNSRFWRTALRTSAQPEP